MENLVLGKRYRSAPSDSPRKISTMPQRNCYRRQVPSSRAGLPHPHEYRHKPDRGQSEHNGRKLSDGGCGRCVRAATLLPVGDSYLQKTLIQTAKIQSSRGAADVFIPMAVLVEDPTAIGSTESASGKNRILLIDGQKLIVTNKGTYTLLRKRVDGKN